MKEKITTIMDRIYILSTLLLLIIWIGISDIVEFIKSKYKVIFNYK